MAIEASAKTSALLFEFKFGNTVRRYTDNNVQILFQAQVYTSKPTIEVLRVFNATDINSSNDGPNAIDIRFPVGTFPELADMEAGYATEPIEVRIREWHRDFIGLVEVFDLFHGYGDEASDDGKEVRLRCINERAFLSTPMGIPVWNECAWQFADPHTCKANVASFLRDRQIVEVKEDVIYIPSNNLMPFIRENLWDFGFVRVGELRIGIKRWSSGSPDAFVLMHLAPPSWVGKTGTFHPGCNKSIANCREWAREESFMGLGNALPNKNPVLGR